MATKRRRKNDVESRLREIVCRARRTGLSSRQLAQLDGVRLLRLRCCGTDTVTDGTTCCGSVNKNKRMLVLMVVVVLVMLMFVSGHVEDGYRSWKDLRSEKCTIEMPSSAQDYFRPPVDCSMCRNVSSIERVAQIDKTHFAQRYAYSGRPVVVTDGTLNWSAPGVFNFGFFKGLYAEDSDTLLNFRRDCQFFPYRTDFRTLRDAFTMPLERATMADGSPPWYIGWSNCDSSAASQLRQHYQRPYFLPDDAESSKTDWIFMGSPGYGAHLHIDHVGNPSWQAQITGRKRWFLEPPPECYYECTSLDVIVEPGEIIVLDTNRWYHQTLIVGDEMSITIGSEYD